MEQVYGFREWDRAERRYVASPLKRTIEGIIATGGEVLPGTAETVADDQIDFQGFYRPVKAGSTCGST